MRAAPHTKAWYINRIGREIQREPANIFNQPILIQSQSHAIALYLTQQEKGYKYLKHGNNDT